jgi:DNA repair and recombination RAD54-like protein
MHRPKAAAAAGEYTPAKPAARLYGCTLQSADSLRRPFKCPGSAVSTRVSEKPARKKRKVNYAGAGGEDGESDKPYSNEDRLALATRDANRFPVFKPKDKDTMFKAKFAVPLLNKDTGAYNAKRPAPLLGMRLGTVFVARPLHDPSGEFAIVLYDPTVDDKPIPKEEAEPKLSQEQKKDLDAPLVHKSLAEILGLKKTVDNERPRVPVVIDPRLSKVLRPHQVEGVKFLYRATTGMIDPKANGCIMADEMGLGKTLQCIALMWTLLKQAPDAGKSTIQKCVIACPSSLVRNWANELIKWLGKDAVTPFAIDGKASKEELIQQIRQWSIASGRAVTRPVLIVSYETLRLYVEEFGQTQIGLMLCDEGHRLKNGDSLTFVALNSLNVQRRVILSGTPIQNDLSEYFALLNFANPNYLGTRVEFRKQYELPILRGRDANGTEADIKKGNERLAELLTLVNKFIIRRTNDILSKYLPVKYEHVVFCNLAPFQKALYNHFIKSPDVQSLLRGKGSQPLKVIGMLKKLCNHPDLLNLPEDLPGCEHALPADFVQKDARGRDREVKTWYSGKMAVLDRMLARIRAETNDKIVLISNYTQTLDIFAALCRSRSYGCLRLDGTMNVSKRQKLVDKFNDPEGPEFVFLLSSKAGGCGLNLIGANRLGTQRLISRLSLVYGVMGRQRTVLSTVLSQPVPSKRRFSNANLTSNHFRLALSILRKMSSAISLSTRCVNSSSTETTPQVTHTTRLSARGVGKRMADRFSRHRLCCMGTRVRGTTSSMMERMDRSARYKICCCGRRRRTISRTSVRCSNISVIRWVQRRLQVSDFYWAYLWLSPSHKRGIARGVLCKRCLFPLS